MVKPSKAPNTQFPVLTFVYTIEPFQLQTKFHFPHAQTSLFYSSSPEDAEHFTL